VPPTDTPTFPLAFILLPLFLLLRMALNAIDGMLAREFGQQSPLGAILNEVGDVVSDSALYAPFALLPGVAPLWLAIVIFLAGLSELVGVLGQVIGAGRRYDGPMGKSDRALVFGALGLLFGLGVPLFAWWSIIFGLMIALLLATIGNRIRQALRTLAPST
jgi:CDP-diacylglycerol--glycerol-3-phosphate 3-phosphatidyltransferase